MTRKPVTIVGGGFAGLALGIALRQAGVPVLIREAGEYPRHRVCGEFLSGAGQDVIARLGVLEKFKAAGATAARTARFSIGDRDGPVRTLPAPGMCLSRYSADRVLAERFRALGGDLCEQSRWRDSDPAAEGLVLANGRRLEGKPKGWRWFGLKVHAHNVRLNADLEMHSLEQAYVGICRVEAERVNVCGLFRRRHGSNPLLSWPELLSGPRTSSLRRTLEHAVFDTESYCAIAGLSMAPFSATKTVGCRLGDAITMIPPVTGNGMSMALESSAIAAPFLAAYARGEFSWQSAQQRIAAECDSRFRRRLVWARWLQWMMFSPLARGTAGQLALNSGLLWRILFSNTR